MQFLLWCIRFDEIGRVSFEGECCSPNHRPVGKVAYLTQVFRREWADWHS
jgi:hypothetical protein